MEAVESIREDIQDLRQQLAVLEEKQSAQATFFVKSLTATFQSINRQAAAIPVTAAATLPALRSSQISFQGGGRASVASGGGRASVASGGGRASVASGAEVEQRQKSEEIVRSITGKLKSDVEDMEKRLAEFEKRKLVEPGPVVPPIFSNSPQLMADATESRISSLEQKIDDALQKTTSGEPGPLAPHTSNSARLLADATLMADARAATESRISSLEQKIDDALRKTTSGSSLEKKVLDALQKTTSGVDAQIAGAIESRMAGVEQMSRSRDLDHVDAVVESRMAGIEQRLSADGSGVETMTRWIDRLSVAQDQLLKRQLDVESSLSSVLQRLVDSQSRTAVLPQQSAASSTPMMPPASQVSPTPQISSSPRGTRKYGLSGTAT